MAKDALNRFANMLYEEANTEKKEMISDLEKRRDAQLSKADAKLKRQSDAAIRKGAAALKQQKRLSLTRREMELHKALLKNRVRAFDEVFEKVTENVRAFAATDAYADFFKQRFDAAYRALADTAAKHGDAAEDAVSMRCIVMPRDEALAKKLLTAQNLTVVQSEDDFIGGFILENTANMQMIDCTLAAGIEEQKDLFYENSGLIME